MSAGKEKLKILLVDSGIIESDKFFRAVRRAENLKRKIEDVLVDEGYIQDGQLGRLIASDYGYDYIDLKTYKINKDLGAIIPEKMARDKRLIIFDEKDDSVHVATTNINNQNAFNLIKKRKQKDIKVYYTTKRGIDIALSTYEKTIKDSFTELLGKINKEQNQERKNKLIVVMVDKLFRYAYRDNASDIHLEPYRDRVEIRFRIDGIMHKLLYLPREYHELILSRIKILARMRTDEHRKPQDGKLRVKVDDQYVDVRVSVVPIVEGENLVMRLLSSRGQRFDLEDIGLSKADLDIVKKEIKKTHGMILVTGPTGSGKTTTLYSVLRILNDPKVHISTIEDPVEYDMEGVSQIQVNTKTDLTFAKGLRAIVRQDPDIIMVGEIRDEETSEIAVNSSLTGHLVLSTLHTNSAAATLPRLADMKIEPYLIASTVNIVIAQRLLRRVCNRCRVSFKVTKKELESMEINPEAINYIKKKRGSLINARLYKGTGCNLCGKTGYYGRVGVFEILQVTPGVRKLITDRAVSVDIFELAKKEGMKTMLEDGVEKVLNGVTTLEELTRLIRE